MFSGYDNYAVKRKKFVVKEDEDTVVDTIVSFYQKSKYFLVTKELRNLNE